MGNPGNDVKPKIQADITYAANKNILKGINLKLMPLISY